MARTIGVDDAVGVKQLVLADVVDAEVVPGSDLDQPGRIIAPGSHRPTTERYGMRHIRR